MRARIYQPSRNPMQSGTAKAHDWVLEHVPSSAKKRDPLMGWSGSKGSTSAIQMRFATREEAEDYAQKNNIAYDVLISQARTRKANIRKLGYAENFTPTRRLPWTH